MDLEPEEVMDDRQLKGEGRQNSSREMLEELSADISRRWLGGYEGLEIVPGIVGTIMLGVSATEMVLNTVVRMSVLYAWKGPGPWMAAGGHHALQMGPGVGTESRRSDRPGHGGQGWRSKPSLRRGRTSTIDSERN